MRVFLLLVSLPWLVNCASSGLAQKTDYHPTRVKLTEQNYRLAQASYHKKEPGGFVTTLEKSWLALLQFDPNAIDSLQYSEARAELAERTSDLLKISDQLAGRDVIYISSEAKNFFYAETEEGYFPAEHEVLWLHLLAGLSFAKLGEMEKVRVEAQRATQILELGYSARKTGRFDDPGMRVLLAALWLSVDEWEHARVDLRVAGELSQDYQWATELSRKPKPPENFLVVLGGEGHQVRWSKKSENHSNYLGLQFVSDFQHEDLHVKDGEGMTLGVLDHSHGTSLWYDRHLKRNTAIRETLSESNYMVRSTTVHTASTAGRVGGGAIAASVGAVAIAAGVAIVGVGLYALAAMSQGGGGGGGSGSAEVVGALFTAGGLVAKKGVEEAGDIAESVDKNMDEFEADKLDMAKIYRFVRFLPERIYAAAIEGKSSEVVIHNSNGRQYRPLIIEKSQNRGRVFVYYIPAHFTESGQL